MSEWHTGWMEGYASARAETKAELATEREVHEATTRAYLNVKSWWNNERARAAKLEAELAAEREAHCAAQLTNHWLHEQRAKLREALKFALKYIYTLPERDEISAVLEETKGDGDEQVSG